ncbi:MAG: 2-hydroxy-6-oxononadienedioate/2-hydroxy-6-oxononatrienedioate hydrolase [Ferruginibacter sp.]|uniref:alpha/beta fold hydrolase n=1 Tax=Ferruginibacter sp. TaxID=1940288 RepID=UPI0026590F63|nr:alpha/beta hydrolase [Ferruginibacter sp.]MDB5276702.1 2-hydroxy-6-oxononadienedioate/2-hydroxy-6-oxononatrienedioate hydrolase [Ferruginibacter sp.]
MQKWLLALLSVIVSGTNSAQVKANYGNNKAAAKYYDVRGMKMYVEEYGNGKPLLLIHGNGGSISSMTSIIPYFSKQYKVIVTDSRAHGKSTDTNDSLSFEMMADDEAALLDKMHIDSAYVIGWSDGGIIALSLAMRHPGKVIKLASTGANLWPDSTALIPSLWKDEQKHYDALHTKKMTDAKEKNDWKIFMLDWLQPNIPLTDLTAIQCPSLIISGDHDLIVLEHTVQIFKHIPHAYLWILPDSGHGTLEEHTSEFNQKVHDFFVTPFHQR